VVTCARLPAAVGVAVVAVEPLRHGLGNAVRTTIAACGAVTPRAAPCPRGLTATMEHCCCPDSNDVPSWRLRPRAGPRIRGAGRARGAHGACGKAVAVTGRARGHWRGWKRAVARDQLPDSLKVAQRFPHSPEFPRSFSGRPPHGALKHHRTSPYRRTQAITRRRLLTIGTASPQVGLSCGLVGRQLTIVTLITQCQRHAGPAR